MASPWTAALDALLVENYKKGLSFRQIASAINDAVQGQLSRNACIGRALRLHLPPRPGLSKPATKPKKIVKLYLRPRQWVTVGEPTGLYMEEYFLGVSFADLQD